MSHAELINDSLATPIELKEILGDDFLKVADIDWHKAGEAYEQRAREWRESKPSKQRVSVTEEDIREGRRGSAQKCPVARAITRLCQEQNLPLRQVMVGSSRIQLSFPWGMREMHTPSDMGVWITQYDNRRPVPPIDFVLPSGMVSIAPQQAFSSVLW